MSDAIHDSGTELLLADFQSMTDSDNSLALGQSVVVCAGLLKGATGTVVNSKSPGHYMIELSEQNGQIWANLPARVLRPT